MRKSSLKIIIAAALVLAASNLLAGCSAEPSEVGIKRLEEAQEMKKTVNLYLVAKEDDADHAVVQVVLDNPENKPITSVQAWLTYNPAVLKGISIDTGVSDFELEAPYNNDFDQETGLVMLGRSTSKAVRTDKIVVAGIKFERVGEGAAMIEAYDYQQDLTGHTSANIMKDGMPLNVLLKPQSPLPIVSQ
ncbi:hypothetical protein JXD20_01400 [Candidatus Peregrinibacteria bacterium]|nr:hypothetical protein [Candidatus Peregrinibacteria bacterium]